jgi:hypothetical protein
MEKVLRTLNSVTAALLAEQWAQKRAEKEDYKRRAEWDGIS